MASPDPGGSMSTLREIALLDTDGVGRIHDVLLVAGDWAVVHPGLPAPGAKAGAPCGACAEGCCGEGWAVVHLPSRRALVQPLADEGRAEALAQIADSLCPKGAMGASMACQARTALEAAAAASLAGLAENAFEIMPLWWTAPKRQAVKRPPPPSRPTSGTSTGFHRWKATSMAPSGRDVAGGELRPVPLYRCTRCRRLATLAPERSDFAGLLADCSGRG